MKSTVHKTKKRFYGSWLALGLIQMFAFAVLGIEAGESLFSQAPAEASEKTVASQSPSIPVRVSRTLFEKELEARVSVTGADTVKSPVRWNENAESLPPAVIEPGQTPLMVNNDHIGCAELSDLSPMRLCFLVQADVDSVALRTDQMWVEGIGGVRDPKCVQLLRLTDATRSTHGFTVTYQILPAAAPECGDQAGELKLTITDRGQSAIRSVSYRYSH